MVAGRVSAGRRVQAACQRQLDDLGRDWEYRFDEAAAVRVCRFVELFRHIKGKWAATPIVLEPWQIFCLAVAFGWRRPDGLRRFRTVQIWVPRKNAKSTLTSAVALYMLTADGEGGAECYSAATTREQARIVFDAARTMAQRSPAFQRRFGVEVRAHCLVVEHTASKLEPLSAEGSTMDGLNVHFAALDELHAHKRRDVFDVLHTATGARTQPLMWLISTAGSNRAGVGYEQLGYLRRVLDGALTDETLFGVEYSIDDDDDWTDPAIWAKANPNYGVSVFVDDLESGCRRAMATASEQPNFLTKRLNVWVNADQAWMDMRAWGRCAAPGLSVEEMGQRPSVMAVDLATKTDIASRCWLFWEQIDGKKHYWAFWRHYCPQARVEGGENAQYAGWELDGWLAATPGPVTDIGVVRDDVLADAMVSPPVVVAYDPWQATQMAGELAAEGLTMLELRPTVQNFSAAMKELEAAVLEGRFHHAGDPVAAWMASNVVCHTDAKDNVFPRKERGENKIDGMVAAIMAVAAVMVAAPAAEPQLVVF